MLATTALCLAALAQAGTGRPETFRGMVVEKWTGRPLAGASIRFSDEPDAPMRTTDGRGRFEGLPTGGAAVPFDNQPGPPAWVRAEDDRAWPWDLVVVESLSRQPDYARKMAAGSVYSRVETLWKGDGPGASLIVECPQVGEVEAVVLGPDGLPAADRPIRVIPTGRSVDQFAGIIRYSGRTDRAGAFRLRSFEGLLQFDVEVPGVGFGSAGGIEVVGGKVARPPIPLLARFARVEGRLAPALLGPGTTVDLLSGPFQNRVGRDAPSDEQGRFALVDVVPGPYRIVARRGGQNLPAAYREVRPEPGRVLGDVVLEPAPPLSPQEQRSREQGLRRSNGDPSKVVPWVEGTIRDEAGRPISGASVYLHVEYHGGMRMYQEVKKTTADDRGAYKFEGPLHSSMGTLALVVSAKGRPPTIAHAPGPDALVDEGERKPARCDVVPGLIGASARVAVLRDGKRLPGVAVRLSPGGAVDLTNRSHVARLQGAERDAAEVEALLSPTAMTGADGVARFENLLPGEFELIAADSPDPARLLRHGRPQEPGLAYAIVKGLAAPPGGRIEATAAVHSQPGTVRFRLLGPDGSQVAGRNVYFGFGEGRTTAYTGLEFDAQGIASYDFDNPGLWAVELRSGAPHLASSSRQEEPYDRAEALIPVSPGLALDDPLTLRAARRGLASIRARLLDAGGAPARGTVMVVDEALGAIRRAGTVDAGGSIRFDGLASGKYRLQGSVDGQAPAPRPRLGGPRLDDAALLGHSTVFDRLLTLAPGAEATADLRLEPVGYVRASLRAPAGRSASEYTATLVADPPEDGPWGHEMDREGTSYLFGPTRPGRWPILLYEKTEATLSPKRGERPVVVEPGRVARVEVEPDPSQRPPEGPRSRRQAYLGVAGISLIDPGPEDVAATIVLADGSTPAFGARALFFPAGEREAILQGIADGSGRLTWGGRWRILSNGAEAGPEPLKEPTIAAWMPGLSGPVVARVEPGKPLRLVLPAPAGGSGRVTLGGRGIGGRNARVRVVAVAEGRGALAIAFDREATAGPDGRFRLPGLAPGRYVVQASRDDIWLSKSAPLLVDPGRDAAPTDLDIPEPGAPVALGFVDGLGRPIPGLSFSIRRPEGPLARPLAMADRADDRGESVVRGLEAGPQSLVADGDPEPHAFDVPPALPGAPPRAVRVEVARPLP